VASGSGGGRVMACLFSQCIMALRSLLQARGSGCQNFNSPLYFTSAKCGSSISARSLIHRVHTVCICVSVVILDLFVIYFKNKINSQNISFKSLKFLNYLIQISESYLKC
jgi:hypothetical protein